MVIKDEGKTRSNRSTDSRFKSRSATNTNVDEETRQRAGSSAWREICPSYFRMTSDILSVQQNRSDDN